VDVGSYCAGDRLASEERRLFPGGRRMGVGRGLLRIGLRNGFGFLIAKSEELENTIEERGIVHSRARSQGLLVNDNR